MVKKYGSRLEVWRGKAQMTTGELRKKNLKLNSNGKIVSKKKSNTAKKSSPLGSLLSDPIRKKKLTVVPSSKRKRKLPTRY